MQRQLEVEIELLTMLQTDIKEETSSRFDAVRRRTGTRHHSVQYL